MTRLQARDLLSPSPVLPRPGIHAIRKLPVKLWRRRMWWTTTACALAIGGCGFAKTTLPDGRELVGSTPARGTYLEGMALRYEVSQDLHCPEDDIRARWKGRHRWQVSGCGKVAHYTCEHEDGPGHFEVVFHCSRVR